MRFAQLYGVLVNEGTQFGLCAWPVRDLRTGKSKNIYMKTLCRRICCPHLWGKNPRRAGSPRSAPVWGIARSHAFVFSRLNGKSIYLRTEVGNQRALP